MRLTSASFSSKTVAIPTVARTTVMEKRLHMLLYRAFHGQKAMLRPVRESLGLGPGQPKLLLFLRTNGPAPQRAIASYLHLDPGTVSRLVEPLLRNGFIEILGTDDRRVNIIALTEKGRTAAMEWDEACSRAEERMLAGFDEAEKETLLALLKRVAANLGSGSDE